MILPNKYIQPAQSIIYTGAMILKEIGKKRSNIVDLWINTKKNNMISYNKYVQSLIYLYSIGAINYNEKGEIYNENIKD